MNPFIAIPLTFLAAVLVVQAGDVIVHLVIRQVFGSTRQIDEERVARNLVWALALFLSLGWLNESRRAEAILTVAQAAGYYAGQCLTDLEPRVEETEAQLTAWLGLNREAP